MSQRGRKGGKTPVLTVVPVLPGHRETAPADFDAEERELWDGILRSMRRDWFSPSFAPLLRAYCTMSVNCQWAGREARRLPVGSREQGRAIAQHARLTKTLCSLATKLRLTPRSNRQSIRNERSDAPARPPWLDDA
jgi:hypothetical protein